MPARSNLFAVAGIILALASSGLAQRGNNPPILPDPKMTPGDVLDVTKTDICVAGYSKKVRNVPKAVKDQVYQEYSIRSHVAGEYEVDHLISLELGGSNSIKNLWPESYKSEPWNAHTKDVLENRLHKDVCDGTVELKTAQQEIARDWIAAYKKYFHTSAPLSKGSRRGSTPISPNNPPEGKVVKDHTSGSKNGNTPPDTANQSMGEYEIRRVLAA